MKVNLKSKSGITLVALIITIIVLLILAMVSIRLVMNGGIIDKSKNAVDKYSNEEIMEQIKLAYQEYQMSQYTDNPLTLQQAMDKAFGEGVATVSGDATNGWTVKIGKKSYPIEANGTVGEGLEEGQFKFGNLILGVGDYVDYNPTLNATGQTTYTSYSVANASADKNEGRTSGYTEDQTFDVSEYIGTDATWRVLDVKDGQVRLISNKCITTSYYLKGKEGYIYGKEELNAICSIYGRGKGAVSAASITVEDINGITGYNAEAARCYQGDFCEYGNIVTYTRGKGDALSISATNGRTASETNTFTNYFADGSKTYSTLAEYSSTLPITCTSYSYNPTTLGNNSNTPVYGVDAQGNYNTVYAMLFGPYRAVANSERQFIGTGSSPNYWLASEVVHTGSNYVGWGLRFVNNGNVGHTEFCYQNGNGWYPTYGIRPVITLKADVNLEWNSMSNQWEIQ